MDENNIKIWGKKKIQFVFLIQVKKNTVVTVKVKHHAETKFFLFFFSVHYLLTLPLRLGQEVTSHICRNLCKSYKFSDPKYYFFNPCKKKVGNSLADLITRNLTRCHMLVTKRFFEQKIE